MKNEINKKVFLDNLPTDKNNKICWKDSIGYKVKFIYDDIIGEVEIISYYPKNELIVLKYKNETFNIKRNHFKNCKFGKLLKIITGDFKIEVNTRMLTNNGDLTIMKLEYKTVPCYLKNGKLYNRRYKYYQYLCNKCNYKGWIMEGNILKGVGCSCCCNSPQVIVLGINTIWDTDRWMCDLGVSEEDAKRYTRSSNKKVGVICPDCGKFKSIIINNLSKNKSISCKCGDNSSYPEKFIMGLLDQLNIDYEIEYSQKWSDKKRYDFHIENNKVIIEAHGSQHPGTKYHNNKGINKKSRTPQQELENDIYKEKLAKENGIKNYVVIDCSLSDAEFIKENILNSKLAELYDLSKVDWLECERFALGNRVKEVCDYWNQKEEWETTTDLMKVFKLSRCAILRYLKKGTNYGWCDYNPKYEMTKSNSKNAKRKQKI